MKRCRLLTVGALLLLVPVITISALSENEREPSPEPYSFSYQAESVGGFSSHQESGDGTGKVQGFYIIMGEDGRDRRVDYVADENGYRASISTNEVGTRSESSADAQYNVRLPSQGQLNQAKVTAEEYQYLEEQHAAERERHLASANTKRQQQQQQQQQQFNPIPDRQQQWASSSSQSNGSRVWATNQQGAATWNQQQPLYEQSNSTLSVNEQQNDDGWRRGAKLSGGGGGNQQQQQYATNSQWSASSAPIGAQSNTDQQQQQQRFSSSSSSSSSRGSSSWSNQTNEPQRQQLAFGPLASATTIGPLATALANAPAPAPQRQQAQQAAWQLADRGAAPARLPANGGNYLQRALEQQFMQQAYQLTDQDYPRQSVQQQISNNNNNNNRQSVSSDYNNQLLLSQQQQPQVFANQLNVQQQPQRFDNEQRANFSSVSAGFAQQRPSWQTGTENNSNNIRLTSTGGEFSQVNQQQNNIIEEVSGEQVDAQLTGTSDDTSNNVTGNFTTTTGVQFNQDAPKQQNNFVKQQQKFEQKQAQFVQPITTTTTVPSQPTAPSGFIAINLSQENSTGVQNQPLDQEVESKQPQQQSFFANTQTTSGFGGQKTSQDTGDYQQVTVQQQVSNPTKQVVETSDQQQQQHQQESGSYVDSNQGKQQVVTTFQRVPETTTQAPVEPSTVVVQQQQQQQQQKTQQQVVETSQAPQAEITTTTTSQRPTVFQQYVTSTSTSTAPSRVPYDTSTLDTLTTSNAGGGNGFSSFVQQSSKRPATSVQYQQVDGGVKGGSRFVAGGQRELNSTFFNRVRDQPASVSGQKVSIISEQQQQQQRPISENVQVNALVNATSLGAYQQTSTLTSERPEAAIIGNRFVVEQTNKQSEFNRLPVQQVPYQRPSSFEYNNRQQQRVTSSEFDTTTTTVAPVPLVTIGQQQQQYKGGVKGGSKTGRRQFWQQQQRPLIPSAQRVFKSSVNQQQSEGAPSQASVDYAASVSSYGSRISGR